MEELKLASVQLLLGSKKVMISATSIPLSKISMVPLPSPMLVKLLRSSKQNTTSKPVVMLDLSTHRRSALFHVSQERTSIAKKDTSVTLKRIFTFSVLGFTVKITRSRL